MDDALGSLIGFMMIGDLMRSKSGAKFLLLALIVTTVLFGAYSIWNWPVAKTEKIVSLQARASCETGDSTENAAADHWGVEISTEILKDGNGSLFCTTTSAGRDNEFGTSDDLTAKHQNINKSRIAGSWLKKKGIEAVKGVFLGDKSEEITTK